MAKPKQARWVCPLCEHGKLAPTRPRMDDVRRYCLPCSEQTGRLVKRVAPALERKREVRTATLDEKRKAREKRERQKRADRFTVDGLNLEAEMKRLCRLKVFWRGNGKPMREPTLIVKRMKRYPQTRLGWCRYSDRTICVIAYPGIDRYDAMETLLHELVHVFEGTDTYSKRPHHGDNFKRRFRDAMREAYGVSFWPRTVYHGGLAQRLRDAAITPGGMRFKAETLDAGVALARQELEEADGPADKADLRSYIRRDTERARRLRLRAEEVDASTHHVLPYAACITGEPTRGSPENER